MYNSSPSYCGYRDPSCPSCTDEGSSGYPEYAGYSDCAGTAAYPAAAGCPGSAAYPSAAAYPGTAGYPISPGYSGYPYDPWNSGCSCEDDPSASNAVRPSECASVQGQYCNGDLTRIIQECQATCEYLLACIKRRKDCRCRRNQMTLLRDCADICGLAAKFVPRGSDCDRQTALLCAKICECCARECARFCDRLSQNCAKVCCCCAKACRAFAESR